MPPHKFQIAKKSGRREEGVWDTGRAGTKDCMSETLRPVTIRDMMTIWIPKNPTTPWGFYLIKRQKEFFTRGYANG